MSSGKWRPSCPDLNVLTCLIYLIWYPLMELSLPKKLCYLHQLIWNSLKLTFSPLTNLSLPKNNYATCKLHKQTCHILKLCYHHRRICDNLKSYTNIAYQFVTPEKVRLLCFNSLWPGDIIWRQNLGQHCLGKWLVAWWHQAMTWTNVDISPKVFCGIHPRTIPHEILMHLIWHMFENYPFKITTTFPRGQWVKYIFTRILLMIDNRFTLP